MISGRFRFKKEKELVPSEIPSYKITLTLINGTVVEFLRYGKLWEHTAGLPITLYMHYRVNGEPGIGTLTIPPASIVLFHEQRTTQYNFYHHDGNERE